MRMIDKPDETDVVRALLDALLTELENGLRGSDGMGRHRAGIVLSGGKTSGLLFDTWVREYASRTPWEHLHFFWADERCVPPTHADSNHGQAAARLFSHVPVPPGHIHRIRGEADPRAEAVRYGSLVSRWFPLRNGVPVFDILLLGIGTDGHTASVFPEHAARIFRETAPYAVSVHPQTGQRRITVTGRPLLAARHTWFLVTGDEKRDILHRIQTDGNASGLPAVRVLSRSFDGRLFASSGR